ncbi:hypothetical protein HUO09_17410 [Vibrio sp. Y2-5]|uniref:hypothetical protein n=1 Tax=Vibrio sp. Y2-5 TaxID=2743977 RepID=UPI0016605CF7|nr:hypothetical protein [Vibrio sp. Y2-5]MBD0788135.1 hypothetical protein [Vibrio sp. Y2-5]
MTDKIIPRNQVPSDYSNLLLREAGNSHPIILAENGGYFWKENPSVANLISQVGLNNVCHLLLTMGFDQNSDVYKQLYRNLGVSLSRYESVIYQDEEKSKIEVLTNEQVAILIKNAINFGYITGITDDHNGDVNIFGDAGETYGQMFLDANGIPKIEDAKSSESMDFSFKHPGTGEIKTVTLQAWEIQNKLADQLIDELECDCSPVGETNVVECNCDNYLYEFELQERK